MSVQFKNLGESGLKISNIIVGCMSYGTKKWWDWVLEDEETIFKILKKNYDNGLRTFDTADVYSNGLSEILLGKFLKKYSIPRERVVILTKCFFPVQEDTSAGPFAEVNELDFANAKGLSRKHIFDAVKRSNERLGTYIDVFQIHRLDRDTPKKEIMKALNDVVEEGYTRYIGASSMKAVEFAELQYIADKNGWFKFISMQNYYNLLYREEEREMIPFCNSTEFGKVGLIPWSPNARGLLTRPVGVQSEYSESEDNKAIFAYIGVSEFDESAKTIINRVEELAKKKNVAMASIATAWVIHKGASPIVGISSEKRVDDTINALSVKFTDEEIKYLEEPYKSRNVLQA